MVIFVGVQESTEERAPKRQKSNSTSDAAIRQLNSRKNKRTGMTEGELKELKKRETAARYRRANKQTMT